MQRYDKTKLAAEAPPYVTVDGIARILVKVCNAGVMRRSGRRDRSKHGCWDLNNIYSVVVAGTVA
jgi:hypothetical protein